MTCLLSVYRICREPFLQVERMATAYHFCKQSIWRLLTIFASRAYGDWLPFKQVERMATGYHFSKQSVWRLVTSLASRAYGDWLPFQQVERMATGYHFCKQSVWRLVTLYASRAYGDWLPFQQVERMATGYHFCFTKVNSVDQTFHEYIPFYNNSKLHTKTSNMLSFSRFKRQLSLFSPFHETS